MPKYDQDIFGAPADSKRTDFDSDVFSVPVQPQEMPLPKTKGTGSSLVDAGNAVGTGFWKNGILGLAGLPVDTAANVIDLTKAGLGTVVGAVTGKVPDALTIGDRSDVVGSQAWLIKKARDTEMGRVMTQAANPDYEGGYLQAAGGGAAGVIAPNNVRQAINQGIIGVTSSLGAKGATEATGNTSWGVVGGLTPGAIQAGGARVGKAAIIGANPFSDKSMKAGEQRVAQRLTDLRNAGVEQPTLGLATGNRVIGGIENIVANSPGGVGVMDRARQKAVDGMQARTLEAADAAATNRGTTAAGAGIQRGLNDSFKTNLRQRTGSLYDVLDQQIDPTSPTLVSNTLNTLESLTQPIKGAPTVSQRFVNSDIRNLRDAFRADTAGAPGTVMVFSQPTVGAGGLMNPPVQQPPKLVQVPSSPPTNTLPWEAVKKTRTQVGEQLGDGILATGVPDRQWRALYGSLSEDMGNAARSAGPAAERAFDRASGYNAAGMNRLERVAPFASASSPEQAFNMLTAAATERGSLSTLQAVKKSLPQDARGQVAGTVIERLGKATNGVQNADGTAWSPETFLTNWNRMSPKARQELFSGFKNAEEARTAVEAVAKATDMMRQNSSLWSNPSGTAANLGVRATVAGGALGGLLNPLVPVAVGGYIGANRVASGLLTNPDVVKAMSKRNYTSPQLLGAQEIGLLSGLFQ